MSNVTLKNTPVRNRASQTARSSSLRCVSAAEHHTVEKCSKTGRTKPWKHLSMSDLSWNTRQDFLKIPSLWEAALETKRRCFSKVILESNVTRNITRSSDSFNTVPPIVNGGDCGCIARDLETIIVLVLLAKHLKTQYFKPYVFEPCVSIVQCTVWRSPSCCSDELVIFNEDLSYA